MDPQSRRQERLQKRRRIEQTHQRRMGDNHATQDVDIPSTSTQEPTVPHPGTRKRKFEYLYLGDPEYECPKSKRRKGRITQRINELHPSYMALQYPLLFPYGEDSYHTEIPYIDQGQGGKRKNVTMREYYAYRVQLRNSEGSTLLCGGRLFQQFLEDSCCAIESERWFGNPHLFITFTANPKWPEIEAMLQLIPGQKVEDRPDIVARVFRLKLKQLMHCLKKDEYFGATIAEIPDSTKHPQLYEAVSKFMIHGPCSKANPRCPCMVNDKCSKNYLKSFNEDTTLDNNGYPLYRRPQNNRFIKKGDRSIVPYNPGLLLMFDAHINVEWCHTAKAIKYLFKYISKGPDKATFMIKDDSQDEVKAYLDCRYLSASEAAWRIFEFEIQERYPAVMRIPVHLKGEQAVIIMDHDVLQVVIDKKSNADTMLTAWMKKNAECQYVRTLTYAEFPTQYVWGDGWHKRKQGMCIGRMAYVHPTAGERYYLRLLLNIVKGAQSFEDLRTIGHTLYPMFKDACYARGLLNNDKEWDDAMREANKWAMPSQLRELFITMVLFCEVTDVNKLWESNYLIMSEDIERKKRKMFGDPMLILTDEARITYTLIELDKIVMTYGKRLKDVRDMPQPKEEDIAGMENKLIRGEKMYDKQQQQQQQQEQWMSRVKQLNKEQLYVFEEVIKAVEQKTEKLIFVYGHGGTGKTFLYGTISARLRAEGKIVLNVASSGIAALLLSGGRTAHSRFDIPIEMFEESTCNVKQNSQLADLLRQTSLIIWDEAPMDHGHVFEAVDRTMRDILSYKNPDAATKLFGGVAVVLGCDFRQVLPIVQKGVDKI
ncbi:uncharacterized protein LOC141654868 [Silene latifolia]|uniref:uncharacterized protein LOC141654868 n=1 Tax=Silene latifolia TaxID=37657 RepID=UPI003D783CE1